MIGPQASLASPRELPDSNPRVSSAPGGLIVEWTAPQPTISEGPDGRSMVDIPGFSSTNQPGAPRLPFSSVLVALPSGAIPSIEVLTSSETIEYLNTPLALVDQPGGVLLGSQGQVIGGSFITPTQGVTADLEPVMLEPIGVLRGVNLARLSFYPALASGDNLRLTSYLKVNINFGTQLKATSSPQTSPNPLSVILGSAVINPEHLQIASPDGSVYSPNPTLQLASNPTAAIEVSESGITEISYADLAAIGFPVAETNPNYLHLTRAGKAIAYQWLGDDDGEFIAGEKIRFFADPRFSRWTSSDTYFLSVENSAGLRMKTRAADAGSPGGIPWAESLFEENNIYTPECYCAPIPPGRDGDRWVWDRLQRPSPPVGTYSFQLKGVDTSQDANLKIWLIGFTSLTIKPDHKVQVSVNGSVLGTINWDGKSNVEKDFNIPGGQLLEGANALKLTLLDTGAEVDGIWLDAFSVRYALSDSIPVGEAVGFTGNDHHFEYSVSLTSNTGIQIFDVTKAEQPVELTEFQVFGNQVTFSNPNTSHPHDYWVSSTSGILSPHNLRMLSQLMHGPEFQGGDYLIISPEDFIPALTDLVDLHKSNGLEVVIEDVQAIYDAYGGGRPLPSAIQAFLEEAYFSWNKPPLYVLLVGDGTHDPRGYNSSSSATLIPPFLADVDPWAGETAADNRYVSIDGKDNLPDMLIGRLPANNIGELETMVSKIVQHESIPSTSLWQHQAVFVADDADPKSGDFPSLSDILINKYPSNPFSAQRLYYTPSQSTPEEFRAELQEVWDAGSGLIMYTGHSSIHQWAHEILLHLENVPDLNNGHKLPVVLEMTCFTGSFQVPGYPTMDEALLRHPAGGAVATWGSTGLGIATGHHWLAEGFMNSIYQDGTSDIGTATLAGKLNLAMVGTNPDLIDTFTLLGDPATNLERSYQIYLPSTQN